VLTVLSRTGYIFERRLIEEHVQRLGTCPVTQETLTESDLTDIKGPLCVGDHYGGSLDLVTL
jgi:hypothetical protein